jgi:hypothetical protein
MIKVTKVFWHLDHQNFDDSLSMLLDLLVHTMDILRSFLYQDKRRHALKYATLRQPVCSELEDIQLHLKILIRIHQQRPELHQTQQEAAQQRGTDAAPPQRMPGDAKDQRPPDFVLVR